MDRQHSTPTPPRVPLAASHSAHGVAAVKPDDADAKTAGASSLIRGEVA